MQILNLIKGNIKVSVILAVLISMGIAFAIPNEEQRKIEEVKRIAEYDYLRDTIITNAKSTIFNTQECITEVEKEYGKDVNSVSCEYRTYVKSFNQTASGASGATSGGGATMPQP